MKSTKQARRRNPWGHDALGDPAHPFTVHNPTPSVVYPRPPLPSMSPSRGDQSRSSSSLGRVPALTDRFVVCIVPAEPSISQKPMLCGQ